MSLTRIAQPGYASEGPPRSSPSGFSGSDVRVIGQLQAPRAQTMKHCHCSRVRRGFHNHGITGSTKALADLGRRTDWPAIGNEAGFILAAMPSRGSICAAPVLRPASRTMAKLQHSAPSRPQHGVSRGLQFIVGKNLPPGAAHKKKRSHFLELWQ